jgi:hypothetical protein
MDEICALLSLHLCLAGDLLTDDWSLTYTISKLGKFVSMCSLPLVDEALGTLLNILVSFHHILSAFDTYRIVGISHN